MLLGLILAVILTGCAGVIYDNPQSAHLVLPDVVPYSRETQSLAADEAEAGYCPVHVEFGKDYKLMRDQTRIAKEALSK